MKLLTKKNHKFVTGMFWQIPEENKRSINLSKLVKDTGMEMYCQIKSLNQTYGFCNKEVLHSEKNVASLGKFIVEASGLSSSYLNSIICYKFKDSGEADEEGKPLTQDLYGYIVLLNGTICPDEGEYVSDFEAVKESIILKAKKHEIETLYLPSEVAGRFFGIFELLYDAYNNDELLQHIMGNLSNRQSQDLESFVKNKFANNSKYMTLLGSPIINLDNLRKLIEEDQFQQQVRTTKDLNIKYLIPNIFVLNFTSDKVYWNNKLKSNFNKARINSISKYKSQKYKIGALVLILVGGIYYVQDYLTQSDVPLPVVYTPPPIPHAMPVAPQTLIELCLPEVTKYMRDLGQWEFVSMKCDSLDLSLSFNADGAVSLGKFEQLIGESHGVVLNGSTGTYSKKFKFKNYGQIKARVGRNVITDQLQQDAVKYNLDLSIPNDPNGKVTKFTINSQLSPLFLFNHGVLNDVKLNQINVTFNKSTGYYSWDIQGEF